MSNNKADDFTAPRLLPPGGLHLEYSPFPQSNNVYGGPPTPPPGAAILLFSCVNMGDGPLLNEPSRNEAAKQR